MARSFRLNLSLPEDLHIAVAREAELSRRPVQDVIRDALYEGLMDGCERERDLRDVLRAAFAAGATNEEALGHARERLGRPVSMHTVTHYRWRLRREDPAVPTCAQARRMDFGGAA